MGKPDAPTPPNPYATAAAQTGTNVATGVANAFLNNVNQVTPQGSLSYDVTGTHSWTDPSTNQTYNIPRFTSTQSLSPTQQALQTTSDQTKQGLADIGLSQTSRIGGMLGTPFTPATGGPAAGDASGISGVPQAATDYFNPSQYLAQNPDVRAVVDQWAQQLGISREEAAQYHYRNFGVGEGRAANNSGNVQTGFGDAGDITRSYGAGDFSQDRQNVEDALMARMNPQLSRERSNIEQRLADQGIRYGSQAYASAMDDYNRQATDARFAAVGQAGQEQQRMMDMAAQRAGFQNAAQQQAYDQAQGRGSFYNQAQAQQFGQNAQQSGFYNAGLAQQLSQAQSGFNAQNAARNQYMQEQYAQRNQPMNEISALMGGSQVQQPNWLNSPTSQIANTDFAGIMNANAQLQAQNYQTAQSGWNSTMGGILGAAGSLGGAAYLKSDRNVKENIDRIGTVFAATPEGERKEMPIHQYSYRDDPDSTMHTGPMAQDVEKIDRSAVRKIGGVRHIDTRKVMGSILRAA